MRHLRLAGFLAAFLSLPLAFAGPANDVLFPVTIMVDAAKPVGEMTPIWRFFGADEANYAYMKNGKKLLSELGQLGGRRFISAPIICSRAATARIR